MATHSSTLAWRIPWIEEPGGLQSMGSQSQTRLSDLEHTQSPYPHPAHPPVCALPGPAVWLPRLHPWQAAQSRGDPLAPCPGGRLPPSTPDSHLITDRTPAPGHEQMAPAVQHDGGRCPEVPPTPQQRPRGNISPTRRSITKPCAHS